MYLGCLNKCVDTKRNLCQDDDRHEDEKLDNISQLSLIHIYRN